MTNLMIKQNCSPIHQSGDTTRFCSQYTKIHFHGMTRERNLNIFMTSWKKPPTELPRMAKELLVFGGEMTSVVNPQRCLVTGIRTNRRQNKIPERMNKSKTKQGALFNTGNQSRSPFGWLSLFVGEAHRGQSARPQRPWHTATGDWRLAAHRVHSPQDGRHNAQHPTDKTDCLVKWPTDYLPQMI